jgi:acetylglutamate synthase
MSRRRTVTVDVDVDVDLEDFDTEDLIDELEDRGLAVFDDGNDDDIVDTVIKKGYTVYGKKYDLAWELYQAYLLDDDKQFRKHVAKVLEENGYKP